LRIIRGTVLKNVGCASRWPDVRPAVALGAVTFTLAVRRFRKSPD
jgi:hypothetical protein